MLLDSYKSNYIETHATLWHGIILHFGYGSVTYISNTTVTKKAFREVIQSLR